MTKHVAFFYAGATGAADVYSVRDPALSTGAVQAGVPFPAVKTELRPVQSDSTQLDPKRFGSATAAPIAPGIACARLVAASVGQFDALQLGGDGRSTRIVSVARHVLGEPNAVGVLVSSEPSREDLTSVASARLRLVSGVEAAYLDNDGGDRRVYVWAREHGLVDRSALLEIEDELAARYGDVEIAVRAHQGRDPDALMGGLTRLV